MTLCGADAHSCAFFATRLARQGVGDSGGPRQRGRVGATHTNRYAHRPTSCYSSGFARGIGRMIVTAWNNGSTGYGVRVTMQDREQFFSKEWRSVTLELEGSAVQVEVNVAKPSFWSPRCGELINREIGTWLKENGLAPWPRRDPPKLLLAPLSNCRFLLHKPSTQHIK